jgi:hypothetical protein
MIFIVYKHQVTTDKYQAARKLIRDKGKSKTGVTTSPPNLLSAWQRGGIYKREYGTLDSRLRGNDEGR